MEKAITTKDKIIFESLKLFSSKGFDGVSMREIAAAVGIKGASLYNHFKGKDDIFQAIFDEMINQYDNAAALINVPMDKSEHTLSVYHNADENLLLQMAEGLFSFFTQNEFASMFRKMLVTEQHKSSIAAKCYKEYYLDAPVQFQSQLFEAMQKSGDFKGYDTKIMALHFYSPVYYVLSKFDLGYPYEECLELVKKHVHNFCLIYKKA